MLGSSLVRKGQIALEFLIVYSFVLVIFILIFSIITMQRASMLAQEQYSLLESQSQNIASYIDQAAGAGNGYSATIPLISGVAEHPYNLSISSTGVIITSSSIGPQPVVAYAFSTAKSFSINGTVVKSGSGVAIYQLNIARGSISVVNVKGVIYIDKQPPPLTGFAQTAIVSQVADVKTMHFPGSPSGAVALTDNAPILNTPNTMLTVTAWVYPQASAAMEFLSKSNCAGNFGTYIAGLGAGSNRELRPSLFLVNTHTTYYGSNTIPIDRWSFVAITFNSLGTTSAIDFYTFNNTGMGLTTQSTSASNVLGFTCYDVLGGGGDCVPQGGTTCNLFTGDLANIQVYNTTLSANSIWQLYNSGIGGQASPGSGLVGWWPLNGNLNDYSGYGNAAADLLGAKYQDVMQLNSQVISGSNSIANVLVGFISSAGMMSNNGLTVAGYTNSSSDIGAFVTGPSGYGQGNVVEDVFQGNLSTEGNLIGWWPLDTGYGTNAYDLSGYYDNGIISNTNIFGVTQGTTPFLSAQFPGDLGGVTSDSQQDGFITVNSAQSLLNIARNESFTLVAWMNYTGATSTVPHNQGVFGDWPGSGAGFQLVNYCISCANTAVLYIDNDYVPFPSSVNSLPPNRWEMVTAEYNGTTGLSSVYVNSTLFASAVLPRDLGLAQSLPFYIGDDASQPTGLDSFNGSIGNVQLYSRYLPPSDLYTLYAEGPNSAPLTDLGLISWWPLAGNANDYSFNNNNGAEQYNVIFTNSNYTNYVRQQLSAAQNKSFAHFSGSTNIIIPYSSRLSTPNYTVSMWISALSGGNFDSEVVDALQPNGHTFDMQLCDGSNTCNDVDGSNTIFSGLHSDIGNGASWLATNANYAFPITNNWVNLVECVNTTTWTIYSNGNRAATGSTGGSKVNTPSLVGSSDYIELGEGSGISNGFTGYITDVQMYNTTLTKLQVLQLYTQGQELLPNRLNFSFG